ncbi:MAG: RNA chaperone Hfq [Clostridiales bacterium]|nr:RNA chaperone Hfq [Clostridiales bacterium]
MQKNYNLQDYFLNQARKERVPLTIFLMNGVQMKGQVRGFDNFIVIIESDGKQQMVYKHAISTIIPIRHIDMSALTKQEDEEE